MCVLSIECHRLCLNNNRIDLLTISISINAILLERI